MDPTATRQTWEVRSMSDRDRLYIVRQNQAGAWSCSCPDFAYRCAPKGEGHYCKHIRGVLEDVREVADGAPR